MYSALLSFVPGRTCGSPPFLVGALCCSPQAFSLAAFSSRSPLLFRPLQVGSLLSPGRGQEPGFLFPERASIPHVWLDFSFPVLLFPFPVRIVSRLMPISAGFPVLLHGRSLKRPFFCGSFFPHAHWSREVVRSSPFFLSSLFFFLYFSLCQRQSREGQGGKDKKRNSDMATDTPEDALVKGPSSLIEGTRQGLQRMSWPAPRAHAPGSRTAPPERWKSACRAVHQTGACIGGPTTTDPLVVSGCQHRRPFDEVKVCPPPPPQEHHE